MTDVLSSMTAEAAANGMIKFGPAHDRVEGALASVGGCAVCGGTSPIKSGKSCKKVQSCSIECQKADWTSHQQDY